MQAGHVDEAAGIFGTPRSAHGLLVFSLDLANDLDGIGGVWVDHLEFVELELNALQLVAIGRVLVVLEPLRQDRETFHDDLTLSVSLGLSRGERRGSISSGSHI